MTTDPSLPEVAAAHPQLISGAANLLPDFDAEPDTEVGAVRSIEAIEAIEVSRGVLFLISDESRYVTGAQLPVDAGCSTRP
jgi:NAD(P)-dependent dehydrogenase (short-subunit alcohol dehydrogenase family)